jgi:hypothetical protein
MANDNDKENPDKPTFVTGDKHMTQDEINRVMEGPQYSLTPERLMELARMAKETYDAFEEDIRPRMTVARAVRIKELREASSWRAVADATYQEWGDDAGWGPPSNQLAGMALTKLAAELLGENEEEW